MPGGTPATTGETPVLPGKRSFPLSVFSYPARQFPSKSKERWQKPSQVLARVEVPDPIARQLHLDGPQGTRRALEELALEGYRLGDISRGQVAELLGLTLWETEAFLKDHGCGLGMTPPQFENTARRLRDFIAHEPRRIRHDDAQLLHPYRNRGSAFATFREKLVFIEPVDPL